MTTTSALHMETAAHDRAQHKQCQTAHEQWMKQTAKLSAFLVTDLFHVPDR